MKIRTLLGAICVCLLITGVTFPVASAQDSTTTEAVIHSPVEPSRSRPVRDLPRAPSPRQTESRTSMVAPDLPLPSASGTDVPTAGPIQRDNPAKMPTIDSFDGQGFTSVRPPDPTGEVDDTYFVQAINQMSGAQFTIYDKDTGTAVVGPVLLESLFAPSTGCGTDGWGDPIVQYDQLADRWVMSQFAASPGSVSPYFICVAVSQTADPAGSWNSYGFNTGTTFPDYPKLAVWGSAYFVTANRFIDLSTYAGPTVYALDRYAMLNGDGAAWQEFPIDDTSIQSLQPADMEGTRTGMSEQVVGLDDATDSIRLWSVNVDWETPANSTLSAPVSIPVSPFTKAFCVNDRQCLAQPGTANTLDALTRHSMYRLAYRNFGGTEMMALTHTVDADLTKTKIRWYVLTRPSGSGAPWSLTDQGTFAPDAVNRWTPSVAIDQNGDLGLVYNVSDATSVYPGIRVAGRLYSDGVGNLGQGEAVAQAGSAFQTSTHRWGDYNHISVDPEDDCTFWWTSEYLDSGNWKTRIGHFRFAECGVKQSSATSLSLTGNYGRKGATLLYRPKNKITYEVQVSTGAPGQLAWLWFERWNKASSTWETYLALVNHMDALSTLSGYFKAKIWLPKGKYRAFGEYEGDQDSAMSVSSYIVLKVTD